MSSGGASRTPRRSTRFRRFVALTVALTALYGGVTVLSRQSFLRVQQVTVVGNVHETAGQIIAMSRLDEHPPMLTLNTSAINKSVSQLRWVEKVRVTRQWPHRVTLTITERRPVAVAADFNGVVHLVDSEGRMLDPAPAGVDLPHLAAVGPDGPWPFDRWAQPAATVASRLPVAFRSQVASVSVDAKGRVTLHFTTPVAFYLGRIDHLQAKFVAVASVIAGQVLRPHSYVDVSVPSAVTVEVR